MQKNTSPPTNIYESNLNIQSHADRLSIMRHVVTLIIDLNFFDKLEKEIYAKINLCCEN